MAEAGASRMLRVRSHTRLASSVPPLTRPPPPRPLLLGFIAWNLSLRREKCRREEALLGVRRGGNVPIANRICGNE